MNSIDFLSAFHPDGPWVLTSIQPSKKSIEGFTFTPNEKDKAKKWIRDRDGKQNIYFHVNTPRSNVKRKKTNREDIHSVQWLHVDVDAEVGKPLEDELNRIRRLIDEDCPIHHPTFIVFSGGGYQAFWRLEEPIIVDGDMAVAEEIARYNRQLEIVLGGDNCHNIDRIMRLPGTMNIPNAQKMKKGRVPVRSEVYLYEPERIYSISHFTQAQPLQSKDGDIGNTVDIDTSNIERIDNVDYLDKWDVSERVKAILVQGDDPDEPKKGDNSRSAWLFDVLCQLVRCKVPDDVIFSVVTDPTYEISSSVLDKGSNATKYALRQLQRAKDQAIDPWLRKLNDRFFVVGSLGGKCRVVERVHDPHMRRVKHTTQSFPDFKNRFCNERVKVGKKSTMPVGAWWLQHPMRRQYDFMQFAPGASADNTYNLWRGFSCEAKPGSKHDPFLKHMAENICDKDETHYQYLVRWMARAVQEPSKHGETAIVLRGQSGTGKSFFAKQFGSLWGQHFVQVSDAKHLVGTFNAHLQDAVLVFGDEAFFAGDRRHESVLKTLITEERLMIERKGFDVETQPNFVHLIMASNADWVIPAGPTERRFFVLDVASGHKQDTDYFSSINKSMADGGREHLLHFLLSLDLKDFDVRQVPRTKALLEQKLHSMDPMREWWFSRLQEGSLITGQTNWEKKVRVDRLYDDYVTYCRKWNVLRMGNSTKLGQFLRKSLPGEYPYKSRASIDGERIYMYIFPDLHECRLTWELEFGAIDWDKEDGVENEEIFKEEDLPF